MGRRNRMIEMRCRINGKIKKLKFEGRVKDLLQKLRLSDQIVIVKRKGKIITEADLVSNKDSIEIIRVIFGG